MRNNPEGGLIVLLIMTSDNDLLKYVKAAVGNHYAKAKLIIMERTSNEIKSAMASSGGMPENVQIECCD